MNPKPICPWLDNLNGQLMVMAAHRYCLGRQSYIVGAAIDWIREWWSQFSPNTRQVMVRDTVEALMEGQAGSGYDVTAWRELATWGYLQLPEQDQKWVKEAVKYKNKPWPLDAE